MSASPDTLIDGDWSRPDSVGARRFTYPFRVNGDRVAAYFEEDNWQTFGTFVPQEMKIPYSMALADFYLMAESPPVFGLANLIGFTRTWARVPGDQVTYGSRVISKANFPTQDYLTYWLDSLTGTASVWSPTIASTVSRYITGGTFTVTYKTSTTSALNWNDSNATIAAAVNALADMLTDTTTVTATNSLTSGSLTITRATGAGDLVNISFTSSLTPTAVTSTLGATTSSVWSVARAALNFQTTTHGLIAGQAIRINTGTSGGGTQTTVASVVDANNFTVANASSQPSAWAYYRTLTRTYTPGTDRVGIRMTQKFYLPGVTTGITSATDIPIPMGLLNDIDFLASALAHPTGYQTYDASELTLWSGWPIYTQTLIDINMADV